MLFAAIKPSIKPSIIPLEFTLPEVTLPPVLPTDIEALTALLHTQQQAHHAVKQKALNHISYLFEQFVLLRRRQFGASSEQLSAQARLFDEADALAETTTEAQDIAPTPPETLPARKDSDPHSNQPARGKRSPLPADLKRVEVIHDVPESERTCPCGTPMVEIGQDVSEQLDIVPMQIRVLRHIRKRYGCPRQHPRTGHGGLAATAAPQE